MTRVVFLLVPGVHLLDLAGPAQVFGTAARLGLGYELHYEAESGPGGGSEGGAESGLGGGSEGGAESGLGGGSEGGAESADILTAQGLPVRASTRWLDLDPGDLLLIPGWRSGLGRYGPAVTQRLAAHHAAGGTVASVCAGADALGRAGLLDGRRCTTHHDLQDELATRYPRATVVRDVLYVVDDRVVTSAGIASGIDLGLHIIATRHGPGAAARIAREMVVFARRNGDEPQASAMLRFRSHLADAVHRAQDLIDARFSETLPLQRIASAAGVSERTLTRQFGDATGMTPLRYQQLLRVERAEHLIGHGATVEAAARSVGFADARMLRRLRSRA